MGRSDDRPAVPCRHLEVMEMMQIAGAIHTFPPHGCCFIYFPTGIARRRTDERTGQTGPLVTCPQARHLMPSSLLGRVGRGVHHGQKRKLHHRPNTLPQTISPHPNFSLAIGRRTIHCLGAGVRTSCEARSGFWEGERASEGRGCLERGALNADGKANRKGAALFNGHSSGASRKSQPRN